MARPSRNSKFDSARNPVRTFFFTSKTDGGRALLQTERMANLFIDVLRSYMRAKKFKVHDFVVMPDHVHALLTLGPEISIEKAAQLMKGNFSYRAKKEFGVKWEIWQKAAAAKAGSRWRTDGTAEAMPCYVWIVVTVP